jgi:hypothetical protein
MYAAFLLTLKFGKTKAKLCAQSGNFMLGICALLLLKLRYSQKGKCCKGQALPFLPFLTLHRISIHKKQKSTPHDNSGKNA